MIFHYRRLAWSLRNAVESKKRPDSDVCIEEKMMRWVLVLLVSLTAFSPATASLSRKQRPDVPRNLPTHTIESVVRVPSSDEFRVTETTRVLLDGRPCRYEDVPDGSIILLLETETNESKEILRIHFQTPRRSAR